ncbi:propionate--CoA ligase [Vitreoscilla filiformis]|jgi:propionyl-CoA synthetase|uniref:Propionate--CoA ligase n=1 Tax=Vitreoscilla filiformis TaxID=63 RepID=A0A221KIH7_VITFI|nr:propionate--CoA ligase [Vitreoscilla filiformis]ASM78719.1 propionate--CoA ligase [Vitreoscilla filiformis]
MTNYADFHRRSVQERDAFWGEQAQLLHWHKPYEQVCDYSNPPFAKWFAGGQTNLCYNAVDRHVAERGEQNALIFVSTETNTEKAYSFAELQAEVQRMAAIYQSLGVKKGDRVLIYMPMIPEACFAMLAAVRIGAIHSVVFGGFASHSLASRIDDAQPTIVVSADAGMRGGKSVPYKHLLDEAISLATHKPSNVLMVNRGLAEYAKTEGRDVDYATLREQELNTVVPCEWVDATHPSYILYTSGTTGKPKGVQRDTAGYAVALAASMKHIYMGNPGETYFSTSDIGWVVGHSYIIYGPLINGMATIMYEGLPTRPDAGVWWSLVEKYKVTVMFSAPTAVRVLKKQDPEYLTKYDLSSLRGLFLAGEPLDEPTAKWIAEALGKPIVDNYWQTETGWPILAICNGVEPAPSKFGSPGKAVYGYDVKLIDETTAEEITEPGKKGVIAVEGPLPPGCLQTVWGDDQRYVKTYWSSIHNKVMYSTFDWGVKDEDGYFFILGRTDDVINVAGHRLGTREIEESISSHSNVAEVAVVGVADQLKGQVAVAFAVLKDVSKAATPELAKALEAEIMKVVDAQLGAVARPASVKFVTVLPKTRSGKLLRRAIQAVCEGRDPGDLTTMEDPAALQQVKDLAAR